MALRIIQAGMGGWGRNWTQEVVNPFPGVKLVGCVDTSSQALAQAQDNCGVPRERCFTTIGAALRCHDADAVLITASLPGHVSLAREALKAGKHVLIEKPFAATVAEARRLVDLADKCSLVLMVSQNYRFFPAVRTVAAMLRRKTLGPVGYINIDFRRYANTAPRKGHKHYFIRHPLLLDMAIHHVDLLRAILRREPREVECRAWNPSWSKFREPASAVATITFDDDLVVSYRGSWVSPVPQATWAGEWRIECGRGRIAWTSRGDRGADDDNVEIQSLNEPPRRVDLPKLRYIDRSGALAAFVHALATGRQPESSGRDNLGSIAFVNALIKAAESKKPQRVPAMVAQ